MDVVIRVFKCVSGLEADGNLHGAAFAGVTFCSIRLLVASTQVVNIIRKQGSLIKPIQQTTGASIRVLSDGRMFHGSQVMEISWHIDDALLREWSSCRLCLD
ncbi:rna-binding kh domain-containing protein pepper [Nicotiana attenuata]|uniref:Rna-binding kh domain-containing protein pepper n=1 Tax=Nicotiana attenuata TaxID=49451 RepID=A0A314KWR9_NICAT|nr:rna-binding kh domain-containing protein pepper [Nicotiana attenuata]